MYKDVLYKKKLNLFSVLWWSILNDKEMVLGQALSYGLYHLVIALQYSLQIYFDFHRYDKNIVLDNTTQDNSYGDILYMGETGAKSKLEG